MAEKKYIDNKAFEKLYIEWTNQGKPVKGDLYLKIWDYVVNACKANISVLQKRYNCTYQDYDGKVLDSACVVIDSFFKKPEIVKSITAYTYFPVLGICCGTKAKQQDWENSNISYEEILGYGI